MENTFNKNFKEKLIQYLYDNESLCAYCKYKHLCNNKFSSDGNGNPIFAPCNESFNYIDLIDLDEAWKELKDEIEEHLGENK